MFANRENRLRNTTSFFISNLPDSCNKESLWQAFEHLENLEDALVLSEKDRAGNKFNFIKLSNVQDTEWWMDKLKEVRIEGAVIGVNLAKFNRDGSKVELHNRGNHVSVFYRLQGGNPTSKPVGTSVGPGPHLYGKKTYSSAISPDAGVDKVKIDLPPLNTVTEKSIEFKSLIGEAKDIDILNNMKENISGIMEKGLNLKYLGGLKVLLSFDSPEEAEDFRYNKVNDWEKWFTRLYLWEGFPPLFERIAWIKVLGVPVSLWDRHVINKIGERCGRLVVKSEAEYSDGNMAENRLAILVNTGKKIASEFDLVWKEQVIRVWVEEISGKWSPAFLNEESSESSVKSSDCDVPFFSGDRDSDRGMGDSLFPCMENQRVCTSPSPEEDLQAAHGDMNEPYGELNERREDVSLVVQNVDPIENRVFMGPSGDNCESEVLRRNIQEPVRLSYITQRPKRLDKNSTMNLAADLPDLNHTAENTIESDPFNIEEIFRMEEENQGEVD
ncbi:putative RNA recognition motif domain, nucleotide-binding alpha-beta plait domain superfamily [Helianthus annuus]|nr:putative RNA recognition motif domain, nucleotide-binding alpha-beta plait domain superfamily [Helianthus annuus]